jgi:hypothetical protein
VADFNGDGNPDYALFNASTRQTAIWYMNNRLRVSAVYGPTLPSGWQLVAVGDFNGDNNPDYVLYSASTRQTAIWYLNNNVYLSGAYGPTIASDYVLSGVADFNGDGKPDYLLYNASTRQTAIWYMNNNVYLSGAGGPTIASGYVTIGNAGGAGVKLLLVAAVTFAIVSHARGTLRKKNASASARLSQPGPPPPRFDAVPPGCLSQNCPAQ